MDIADQLKAIHREVRAGTAETIGVLLRRTYDAAAVEAAKAQYAPDLLKES